MIHVELTRRTSVLRMSHLGVRRAKAAFSSGCKSQPAIAPAGSNRSIHGGDKMAEAFGTACHELLSLNFRFGSIAAVGEARSVTYQGV